MANSTLVPNPVGKWTVGVLQHCTIPHAKLHNLEITPLEPLNLWSTQDPLLFYNGVQIP